MPRKSMRKSTSKPRRRAPMRRRRVPVRKYARGGHIKEYASAQYTTASQQLTPSQAMSNGVYAFRNFSLAAASTRVQNIGKSYQEYRIKKVTWQCKGFFDTFVAPSSATAPTVPHLYWRIDKLANFNADTTLNTLKASGCKPIRLDDKLVTKSFKPAVVVPVVQGPALPDGSPDTIIGSYRTSPWLATNNAAYSGSTQDEWVPSSVDHQGLLIAVDCDIVPFSACVTIQFTVEFEFRKPLDDIDPNGEAVMQVVDISDLQPKKNSPPEELLKTTL